MPKSTNPFARRQRDGTWTSPFSSAPRKKNISRPTEKIDTSERLDDVGGLIPSLAPRDVEQNVICLIQHVRNTAFEDVPDRATGMSSTRIAEVLRFRKALPPVVSVAQLHAISKSATQIERELALLVAQGRVRKVTIPGRGKGGAAVGEGVVTTEDWRQRLQEEDGIEDEVKDNYMRLMDEHRLSPTIPISTFSQDEIRSLVVAGFLTNPTALSVSPGDLFARPRQPTLARAGSSFATGTLAAVGGSSAIHDSGGGGSTLAMSDHRASLHQSTPREMTLSLPSTGAYLNLLTSARAHLLHLLKQLSPRYKEATRAFLREKWDGNTPADAVSISKRMRGEFSGVLPGKTKRWRDFYGLSFEWVLAEAVGGGVVECFETGSVGVGVRVR